MSHVFLGVDPGHHGALAVIDGANVVIHDAPTVVVGDKTFMDLHAMKALLLAIKWLNQPVSAFIEKVHSQPGSSPRSMFTFGRGYGEWRGEIVMAGFPLTEIEPARWKAVMMDGLGKEKDAARYRAALL